MEKRELMHLEMLIEDLKCRRGMRMLTDPRTMTLARQEREGSKEEEVIKIVDELSVNRVIEILNAGIANQDLVSSEDVKGLDIIHHMKVEVDKTLERDIRCMKDN